MNVINLSEHKHWAIFVITGIISAPVIPLGLDQEMYILRKSHFTEPDILELDKALKESFTDFGIEISSDFVFNDPKLLLVSLTDGSKEAIKNALIVSDLALGIFNRKYFSARARFVSWDRRAGKALGAVLSDGSWGGILQSRGQVGPAIAGAIDPDFWDWFLSAYMRDQLSELGEALLRAIEWEREAQRSSHITHRFAFNWVGLEAMMPLGEYKQASIIRKYSLIAASPGGADSQIIRKQASTKLVFDSYPNANSSRWRNTIEEMYQYRCSILHQGSSDLSSAEIISEKVDWFYHLSRWLFDRVTGLAIQALIKEVKTVKDFWDLFVIPYLYSRDNQWLKSGVFIDDHIITFDWETARYPSVV